MHDLFLGMMRHGKTTGGIELAREIKALGHPVAVLTVKGVDGGPKDGARWRPVCDFITTNKAALFKALTAKGVWGWHVFVDEANQTVGPYAAEWVPIVTDASSHGITFHFIGHRAAKIDKNIREQCTSLTIFRLGPKDARELAEDWACPQLEQSYRLKKFEYMHCTTELGSYREGRVGKP